MTSAVRDRLRCYRPCFPVRCAISYDPYGSLSTASVMLDRFRRLD